MKNRLITQALGSFGLRVTYTVLTFLTSIFLARLLGATDFGIYTYTIAWAYLLSVLAGVGLDNLLVREVSIYRTQSAWGLLRGILQWANQVSLGFSLALTIVAIILAKVLSWDNNPTMFIAFCLGMISLPFASLRNVKRGAMRGLEQVAMSLLPEMLIAPLLLLTLTVFTYWLFPDRLTALWIIGTYAIVTAITLIISWQLLNRCLPEIVKITPANYEVAQWLRSALPFMLLEGIYVINARVDVLMLGALRDVAAAGIYVPVNRGAQLINFVLMAASSSIAPTIASLYAQGKKRKLSKTIVKTARATFIVALFIAVVLIASSYWYLLLFGREFTQGQTALTILCVGQLIYIATGFAGLTLNMTGYEYYTAMSGGFSAVLNIVLNALFINRWGVEGAALATTISIIFMNMINMVIVRRKLRIGVTVLDFGR